LLRSARSLAKWYVVTLVLYLDDSGTEVASPLVVMAGHIGSVPAWQAFEEEASAILREFGVTYVRGKDIQEGDGEYAGWSFERKREFIGKLNKALAPRIGPAISFAVAKKSFSARQAGVPRIRSPVGFCFARILDLSLNDHGIASAMNVPGVDLSFVIEEGNARNREIQRSLRFKKRSLRLEKKSEREPPLFLTGIAFVAKQSSIAIQTADLFAFLTHRHAVAMERNRGRPVEMHPYLALLRKDIRNIGFAADDFAYAAL
jgi:hypothetical protein